MAISKVQSEEQAEIDSLKHLVDSMSKQMKALSTEGKLEKIRKAG